MKTNKAPARWSLTSLIVAGVLVGSGCSSTPKSSEEPIAEAGEPVAEAPATVPEREAAAPRPAVVVPIQPFSAAYYAERLAAIEAAFRPLTSIPVPPSTNQAPPKQLHNR